MIYTVTFNPAIDHVVHVSGFDKGTISRASSEEVYFGGKGINVSIVLKELGVPSVALGFIAGFTGDAIEQGVREKGIETSFIKLPEGRSRINVKIRSDTETDINCPGPRVDKLSLEKLMTKLNGLKKGDYLVLSGSVPEGVPDSVYADILKSLSGRGILSVVDASGDLLRGALKYRPFLIKPNLSELGGLFCTEIKTREEAAFYAKKLAEEGAENVLVSMGGEGALLLFEKNETYFVSAVKGNAVNTVGAGDSTVAGFIAGYSEKGYRFALELGVACGCAAAFSPGLPDRSAISGCLSRINPQETLKQ